jgi:hypothetical protein
VAKYNVDVEVQAKTSAAERKLDSLAKTLSNLQQVAGKVSETLNTKNAWNAGYKASQDLGNVFDRVAKAGRNASTAITDGLQKALLGITSYQVLALDTHVRNLATHLPLVGKSIAETTTGPFQQFIQSVGNADIGIAALTVGLMAFGPQAIEATFKAAGGFLQVGRAAGRATKNVLSVIPGFKKVSNAAKQSNGSVINGLEGLQAALRKAQEEQEKFDKSLRGASLRELNDVTREAKKVLEGYWSMSNKAEKAAENYAKALKAQKDEQREINDLVKKAQQGLPISKAEQDASRISLANQKEEALGKTQAQKKEWAHERRMRQSETRRRKKREAERKAEEAFRKKERLREGLMLGVGFPLLFGGGPGAILGGGAGAFAQSRMGEGKGFGAQIALSAVGGQIDRLVSTIVKGMLEVGEAVTTTAGAYALLEEKSLFSTKEIKERAKALKEQGDVDKLNTLLTEEYIRLVGREGFNALQDAGTEAQNLKTAWEELTLAMSALMAGPLGDLLEKLTEVARSATNNARLQLLEQDLIAQGDTDIAEKLRDEIDSIRMKSSWSDFLLPGTGMKELSPAQQEDLLKRYGASRKTDGVTIPETGDLGKPKLTSEQKAAKRAAEQYADKLADLEQEIAYEKELMNMDNGSYEMREREADISKAILGLNEEQTDEVKDRLEKLYDLQDVNENIRQQEEQIKAVYDAIGVSIKDGLVEGINAAIDGTKTLGEVASSVFRRISNALLNYGVNIGLSSLPGVGGFFSQALGMNVGKTIPGKLTEWNTDMPLDAESIPFKASGGSVSGGSPYIVGEKGPELFVPGSSGNIVPNNAMGGSTNVVVNVDASGSSVEGDAGQAEQLGSMLAAAVQSEIANQQRPGGLLARR